MNRWLDEIQSGEWPEKMKSNSFYQVAEAVSKRIRGGAGVENAADWFQKYHDSEFMTARLVGNAAANHQLEHSLRGLDFLVETLDYPAMAELENEPPGLERIVRNAVSHDPAMLEEWLINHETVPFRASAIHKYARRLDRLGQSEKAAEWRSLIEQ